VAEKLFQEIPSDKRKIDPCDKVKEFIGHQELSEKLGVDFYFGFFGLCYAMDGGYKG
jgi:IS30 family transposase